MYACPHCGADTFSFWQKELLGPGRSIECRSCGGHVSVPWLGTFACLAPMFILVAMAYLYFGPTLGVFYSVLVGSLVGFAISAPLCHWYVPLIPRKP
jgi:DNA-directed RNA polymerase subunit RPC12/RpoP